ncbi:hypothetical protein Zmor_001654 [Zophobas morio]|uniref:Uncharacterized protein n=1 Tax=Zophobas morio TaxID=2755281 RepID=A0AA38MT01_9CUCU|nr:hypothetical protein Zmor_001654 [Zophobas morio]
MERGRDIARWDKRKYMDLFVGFFWEGSEEVIFKGSLTKIRPMMDGRDKPARDNGDNWGCTCTCYNIIQVSILFRFEIIVGRVPK